MIKLSSLVRHFPLILRMIQHEIIGRYKGSFLGLLWSFVTPVLMLAIYTFVFSFVFKARWGQQQSDQYEFAVVLFSGLIIYNLFSECISRAPSLIINNVNYVKKVIFPLAILPCIALGSALFHAAINFLILLIFLFLLGYPFSFMMFWAPIILTPFLLLTLGVAWFLASLGVFIRDIGQVIGLALTVMLFLSPIFYPLSALPSEIQNYLLLNPVTVIVDQMRTVLIWGKPPNFQLMGIYSAISVSMAFFGLLWFQKTRRGFADVL